MPKDDTKMPAAIKDAAEKMKPKQANTTTGKTGHERNQLITRAGAVDSKLTQRGGPLLAETPEEVQRNRSRVGQLRQTLSGGVQTVERFIVTGERLVTELKTFEGGADAAKAENVDLGAIVAALKDLRASLDKHFPAEG